MAQKRKYGIGLQWFPDFRKNGAVYVDKTAYVYKLARHGGKNYFLSRPRRFGKSLLVSTLQAYFEGRKDEFEGLAIENLETEWIKYPVIRMDLSLGKYYDENSVWSILGGLLARFEKEYGLPVDKKENFSTRLSNIILEAYNKTGQKVVILIDEYDAPMLDSIRDTKLQDYLRQRVRDLFSPLKGQAEFLHFVFLTGISKFSQLSVFSELNNLTDLTFDTEFEGICGITEEELFSTLKPDLEWLTESMIRLRRKNWTYEDCVREVKRMYDGYHFTELMNDIYNPWSLFYAFDKGVIDNYWFSTGTPSSLIDLFQVKQPVFPELEGIDCRMDKFNAPTERISDPIPVLYQSGYLTLKDYHFEDNSFTLGFPNEEVRVGFGRSLYNYVTQDYVGSEDLMLNAYWSLRRKNSTFEDFLESVRKWYAGIPYDITDKHQDEQFYQALFYALMVGMGCDTSAEDKTSDGRMDIALKLSDAIYILEFKFNKTSGEALQQILTKDYAVKFAADQRPVWAVGLNVSADRRTIDSYDIVQVKV
ncbi:MAG: AAA family ATPase [Prevotella sp.]|nr:AAA family ATPase [Prevotella sp.]